jgi:hypothetical protein
MARTKTKREQLFGDETRNSRSIADGLEDASNIPSGLLAGLTTDSETASDDLPDSVVLNRAMGLADDASFEDRQRHRRATAAGEQKGKYTALLLTQFREAAEDYNWDDPETYRLAMMLRGHDPEAFAAEMERWHDEKIGEEYEDWDGDMPDSAFEALEEEHATFIAQVEADYQTQRNAVEIGGDHERRMAILRKHGGLEFLDGLYVLRDWVRSGLLTLGQGEIGREISAGIALPLAQIPTSGLDAICTFAGAAMEEAVLQIDNAMKQGKRAEQLERITAPETRDVQAGLEAGDPVVALTNLIREQNALMKSDDEPESVHLHLGRVVARSYGVDPDYLEFEMKVDPLRGHLVPDKDRPQLVADSEGNIVPLLDRMAKEPTNLALAEHAQKIQATYQSPSESTLFVADERKTKIDADGEEIEVLVGAGFAPEKGEILAADIQALASETWDHDAASAAHDHRLVEDGLQAIEA